MQRDEFLAKAGTALPPPYRDTRDHLVDLTRNYAVKGWLRRREVSVLYGPSNVGKSALVCHLGHCITTGAPFFGARVRPGITLHVGAEAPGSILDRMSACPSGPADPPYIVREAAVDLPDAPAVDTFITELHRITAMAGHDIALVIFDTLARSIGASDENSASVMTAVVDAADRIARASGAHVMLVHHTGKDSDRGARGSSSLRAAVDTEICLQPEEDGTVRVSQAKQRTIPAASPVHFRIEPVPLGRDEDGDDRTTARAVEMEGRAAPKQTERKAVSRNDLHTALLTVLHNRQRSPNPAHHTFDTTEILDALPPAILTAPSREGHLKAINRALHDLAKQADPIIEGGNGMWQILRG